MSDTDETKAPEAFTAEERAAMKQRATEVRTDSRRGAKPHAAADEADVMEKIAGMEESDREMALRVHAIVTESAPELAPKLWYGMPAYYKNGKNICFFQPAKKFKTRYATLGFNDPARLDDGTMWPVAYAITTLDADATARIGELVRRAAG
ncbi:iron chaperone [Diaminobutyricibacter sp. McL0618]|uniref:iron chaperone n=1 Tax=Leifsonia sp. McL0618 TaxID=3415677 RepID=UPI003CF5032E